VTINNTYKIQLSLLLAGFEPAIPANERPQTHALDSPKLYTPYNFHFLAVQIIFICVYIANYLYFFTIFFKFLTPYNFKNKHFG